jgi:hypothetical protein
MRRKGGIVAETAGGLRVAMAAALRTGQAAHAWHNPATHCPGRPHGPTMNPNPA